MKFLKTWLIAVLLSGSTSMALADGAESAWMPAGPVHTVAVSSSASTGEQVVATSSSFSCTQYRLENTGAVDVWVGFGETAALAETNAADIPTAGDTGVAVLVKAGTAQVVSHGRNQYVSAKTASSTSTLYFGCGTGLANGVTGILLGTGTNATQVQGTAASDAPVSGNPLQGGGRASSTVPTAVSASGDAVANWLTLSGAQVVAGSDGTNSQALLVGSDGRVITASAVTPTDGGANNAAQLKTSAGSTAPLLVYLNNHNGSTWNPLRNIVGTAAAGTGTTAVAVQPTSSANQGMANQASGSAESSKVLKASAGNLYSLTVTIGVTSGYLMIFNATSAPVDGAVTPVYCLPVASNGTNGSAAISWGNFPLVASTGITAVFSTTGCFSKTASATASFFGQIQ
jgi:hypothetical protein